MLYIIRANAEVVKRQTRCLQAAVPTRREGSNPFLRTSDAIASLQTKAFLFVRKDSKILCKLYWKFISAYSIMTTRNDAVVEWQTRYFEGVVGQPV